MTTKIIDIEHINDHNKSLITNTQQNGRKSNCSKSSLCSRM
jgi:hypothetical protein